MSASITRHLEEGVLGQAVRSLRDSTGLQASVRAVESDQPDHADGVVLIGDGTEHWQFYVEVEGLLTSHSLGTAIAGVSQIKRERGPTALVASYVNPSQAQKLRQLGVEFFDTAGNAFLRRKGLYVFITGRKGPDSTREARPARAFNPTGSRLVFVLLCHPGLENNPYRDLARKAGISLGATGWIMSDLKSLGYLTDRGPRGRRLLNRKDLLKRWVAAYPEKLRPKLFVGRYHKEGERDWWQRAQLPLQAFWSGEVGARLLTRHIKPQAVTIYAETNLPKLQARYGLRRDEHGEIDLLRKFWMFEDWEGKGTQVVPPLLVYADLLMTADERNLETAAILYDRYISRLVE